MAREAPADPLTHPHPGWRALLSSPLRMRPNLLVIGAQKAGTTSLHTLLAGHPEIVMSRIKECDELVRDRPSAWRHRAFFPLRGPLAPKRARWVGESTPYYMFHPQAATRAAALLPGVRAIAILRDPVDRAWSHYRPARRLGLESMDFGDALAAESGRIAASSRSHRHHSYFARGCYAEQLERWFDALGRERVLVLRFDALRAWEPACRSAVESFLGLATPLAAALPMRNQGEGADAPLPTGIADSLRIRYAPEDKRLEGLIGWRFGGDGDGSRDRQSGQNSDRRAS